MKKKLVSLSFILLLSIGAMTYIGFTMVFTMISKYAVNYGASLSIAGFISGVFSVAALVIRPFSGILADRVNKKWLSIIATAALGIIALGYSISSSMTFLIMLRIAHGLAFGISSTTTMVLLTSYIPEDRLAEGIGYFGLGQVIAQVIGPSLGVKVVELYGFDSLFIITALITFISVIMLFFLPSNPKLSGSKKKDDSAKFSIKSLIAVEVIGYAIVGGVFSFANGVVNAFLILLGDERSIAGIALFFSVNAVILFVMRVFMGRMADKKGLFLIVNIALISTVLSMVLLGMASSLWVILVAAVLKAAGQGSGQLSLQAECIRRAGPERAGIAASTFYIWADIGQSLGPMLGGSISSLSSFTVMFFACAAIIAMAIVYFNFYEKRK